MAINPYFNIHTEIINVSACWYGVRDFLSATTCTCMCVCLSVCPPACVRTRTGYSSRAADGRRLPCRYRRFPFDLTFRQSSSDFPIAELELICRRFIIQSRHPARRAAIYNGRYIRTRGGGSTNEHAKLLLSALIVAQSYPCVRHSAEQVHQQVFSALSYRQHESFSLTFIHITSKNEGQDADQ